jgi:hypothetical protein
MPQEFDYRGWVERAKAFAEKCRRLPGTVGVKAEVTPPLSEKEVDSLAQSLPRGLPDPIRRFVTRGSADCHCHYWWQPVPERNMEMPFDPELRKQVPFCSVFPDKTFIYGGADLCCAFAKGARPLVEGIVVIDRSGFKNLQTGCKDMGEAMASVELKELFKRSVPFADIKNGDLLALDMGHPDTRKPVVYLDHEGYAIPPLAPSFEDFLGQWEQLCYVGPEHWVLDSFRNPKTGFIDSRCDKAIELRAIFQRALG